MPSEILGPIYNNIKVIYEEFYKVNFNNPTMNFVIPSKTLKEILKPKYSDGPREKSFYYRNCFIEQNDHISSSKLKI